VPGSPLRLFAKPGRRLSEMFAKRAGEGLGPLVAAPHGDIDNLCVAKGELIGGPLQAAELDIAVDTDAEEPGELPMEVEFRERGDSTERLDTQRLVQMSVDIVEYLAETGEITLFGGCRHAMISLARVGH